MGLKMLRFLHIDEVNVTLKRLMDTLADIFYMHRYLFYNLNKWLLAGAKFVLAVHYFACGWIMIYISKSQGGLEYVPFSDEDNLTN